jgi:hypothetical protein
VTPVAPITLIEAATIPTATTKTVTDEDDAMVVEEETVEGVEVEGANKPEEPTVAAPPPKKKSKVKPSAATNQKKKKAKVTVSKSVKKNTKKSGAQKKQKAPTVPVSVPVLEPVQGGESSGTERLHGCCGSFTNHEPFNLKSEFNAGYAQTILLGVGCSGSCAVNQVVPATNKPVWLCPILNSTGQAGCKFALCNNCFGIANVSSGSSSRKRKQKNLD